MTTNDSVNNSVPRTSPDFRTELAEQLAEIAPEAITDGKVDVKKLQEMLAKDAGSPIERFGLTWPGKLQALKYSQRPTTATLRPRREMSKNWDDTRNVFIEGDNLEVLKVLQRHYHNRIRVIYIDPPYNTGNEFVYPDNYREGLDAYLRFTQQVDQEGRQLSANTESDGRYHSKWLSMMYPRLKLARNLLTEDGVLFVSIDDHEVENLIRLGKEVFGEDCYLGNICWLKKRKGSFLTKGIVSMHEYVLAFGRSRDVKLFGGRADSQESQPLIKRTNSTSTLVFPAGRVSTKLGDGNYTAGAYGKGSSAVELEHDIKISDGLVQSRMELTGPFIWSQEYLDDQLESGAEVVMNTMNFQPRVYKAPSDDDFKGLSSVFDGVKNSATNEDAYEYALELFGAEAVLEYPKPVGLIKTLVRAGTEFDRDALVLDFFSGSATTAEAVMRLNAEDGGTRRHIQVQLPEPTSDDSAARKAGFDRITDVARFRIDRSEEFIRSDFGHELSERAEPLDFGYRTYELIDTNFTKWQIQSDVSENQLKHELLELTDSAADDASPEELLTEVLLKLGYSLSERVEQVEVEGLKVQSVAGGELLAYLDERTKPSLDQLNRLVESASGRLVVAEDVFQGDDELKTNVSQLCRTHNVNFWTA